MLSKETFLENAMLINRNRKGLVVAIMLLWAIVAAVAGKPAMAAVSIEMMPLWRLQVRITTGNTPTAGTNGTPAVRFNATSSGVRSLNPPSLSAFDRDHVDTYDLRLLANPSEITMFRLGVIGNDDWCIKKVELLFNGRLAFAQDAVSGNGCATITGGTYLEYSRAALRGNPAWVGYGVPPLLPAGLTAADLRALVTAVTGSAMRSSPSVGWDRAHPLSVTRKTSSSIGVTFGIWVVDPSGIETPFRVTLTYDVHLFVGPDGNLHARKTNASCCYHYEMSNAVVSQLDTALSRMTARPAPHDPLHFGVDVFSNIIWKYAAVAE